MVYEKKYVELVNVGKIFMAIFRLQKNTVGHKGEKEAVKFLKKQGYKILDRNWCNDKGKRIGEIDIVAQNKKSGEIVFVEVKTRLVSKDDKNILPQEQITFSKLNKINRIAEIYIKEHDLWDSMWRIDAISVIFVNGKKRAKIEHVQNIFL